MALKGLDPNTNPVPLTNFVKKLNEDPLSWGFLIQDEKVILDYPEHRFYRQPNLDVTDYDYYNMLQANSFAITSTERGIANRGRNNQINTQRIKDHYEFWDAVRTRRKPSKQTTSNHLRMLTQNMNRRRQNLADIKVEITNPFTYTPYLLRKHKKKKSF